MGLVERDVEPKINLLSFQSETNFDGDCTFVPGDVEGDERALLARFFLGEAKFANEISAPFSANASQILGLKI